MSLSKPVTKRRRCYIEEDLDRALAAVTTGAMPLREAAKTYTIPYTTLQRRKQDGDNDVSLKRPGPKPVFDKGIEEGLVETILTFEQLGYGLGRSEILNLAKQVDLKQGSVAFSDKQPSDMWFKRFSERHNLSARIPRAMAKNREEMSTEEVRDNLFETYQKLQERYNFPPHCVYNMDESGLQIVCKPLKIVTRKGRKGVYVKQEAERSENITVVTVANASGGVIVPPMVIFKSGYLTTKIRPDEYPANTTFAVTESGYMTFELFLRWFGLFLNNIPPARPVLMIYDGHVSHVAVEVVEMAKANDIHLLVLPPHTTHIFQPLDVSVFKPLKDHFRQNIRSRMRKHSGIKKYDFGKVFTPAYYQAVTTINIINGFRKTGLWPINKFAVDLDLVNKKKDSKTPSKNQDTPSTNETPSTSTSTDKTPCDSIKDVLKSFLKPSPQKQQPKTSKRITVARCLTQMQLQTEIDKLNEPAKKKRKVGSQKSVFLKRKNKRTDDSDTEILASEIDDDLDEVEVQNEDVPKKSEVVKETQFSVGDFVVVKFQTMGKDCMYIGKICKIKSSAFEVIFLRKNHSEKFAVYFTYPNVEDKAEVDSKDVICGIQIFHQRRGRHYFQLNVLNPNVKKMLCD